jgi:hypothetical protein
VDGHVPVVAHLVWGGRVGGGAGEGEGGPGE